MSIEATISKFKKTNYKIYIAVCIVAAIWLGYDGYLNSEFQEKHQDYLLFNQVGSPVCVGGAVLLGAYLFVIRSKKIVADENELIIGAKEKIPYDSIEKIDKTHFGSKGYFIITYKDKEGNQTSRKISDKSYDNLAAVLEHLVTKIKG
jgi:hypothetical protein